MLGKCLLVGAVMMALGQGAGAEPRALASEFGEGWQVSEERPWWSLIDMRGMLSLFHPFVVSETGKVAGASREITLPAVWHPPFALRFYCADDYFADPEKHKPGMLGTESFFGHRFKQVLIDGRVVWERDVAEENLHASQSVFQVDITPYVEPGKPFRLTFRVFDRSGTPERNERDVWFIGGTWYAAGDGKTEQPPRFHTAVWFADPVIGEKAAVETAPPGSRPHDAVVIERHRQRWPLAPRHEKLSSPVLLKLVSPARIPMAGYPVTGGVPMPPGLLKRGGGISLEDRLGRPIPLESEVTGRWPDGSVRWLLLTFLAPEGSGDGSEFMLRAGKGVQGTAPRERLRLYTGPSRRTLDTEAVRVVLGDDRRNLIDAVFLKSKTQPVLRRLRPSLSVKLDGREAPLAAAWKTISASRGPLSASVKMEGTLDAPGMHIGRFVFRLTAYAGSPVLKTSFRFFNDVKPEPYKGTAEDTPLDVTEISLIADLPGGPLRAAAGLDGEDAAESRSGLLSVIQPEAGRFLVSSGSAPLGQGSRASGWIAAETESGWAQASLWRFGQQFPKSLSTAPGSLTIGLFAPSESVPLYRPRFGEAKRHDITFVFGDGPAQDAARAALGRLSDEPPRLFDTAWFCRAGAVNLLDPEFYEQESFLKRHTLEAHGDVSSEKVFGHFGMRNFGDAPYGSQGQWLNGYWAVVQGALNWGLSSGDRRWLERSFEAARHIADVDTAHIPEGHPDWQAWNGVTCALGIDHSAHGGNALWPAFQIGESLMLHHWMTGDSDSREAALANADYILRSGAGLGSTEARSQARPMLTLLRAWQATGDLKYRRAAARYLDPDYQTKNVIEWRRGAYIQPTYENWRCISAGLDSMYALNIYEYYRLTGDVDAARLVVAIADSVYAESMLPQEEGIGSFLFYVRYSRGSWYYTQMALLFHMAYDLTGDPRFLRAGRAAFARYRLSQNADGSPSFQPVHNFGWLDPEFGGWQREFSGVKTEPFTVTGQTPVPDPAAYEGK
ncbi:MAG: hypothetical protein IT210_09520 [Armatimonadetes bacterium]|nr:hypothetical protein [Armatimonadota bacterium]